MGVVPAIYVYFKKAPVEEYEVDYYENFEGRSRQENIKSIIFHLEMRFVYI